MLFSVLTKQLGGYNGLRLKYHRSKSILSRKIYAFINQGYQHETNCYLPFNNVIKSYINFPHGSSGIFISGDAVIGKNCTIYQQVTIGSNMLVDSNLGSPHVGNNCLIGSGAKIIGNITVGDNCRIGANAVVTKNIPANSVVVIGSMVVLQKDELVNKIYQHRSGVWGYLEDGRFIKEQDQLVIQKLNQQINKKKKA